MHNFMVEMCGSCLKQEVPLFDSMDDDVKNSSVIQDLFREDFNEEFCNWQLCEVCSKLLKGAVILKKGLLSSQLMYRNYLRTFNANDHGCKNQLSNLSVQLQDITIKYETVEEATECITDRSGQSEMQSETKDFKIEIDETNSEEMLNNFHCAEEPTINIKIKVENEVIEESSMVEMEQLKVFLPSNDAEKEGSTGISHMNVETEMDAIEECNEEDTQTNAAKLDCQNTSFNCNICNQKFAKKPLLLAHLKVHCDAKAYKCDFCPKSFTQKSHYDKHRWIHTGEKPHKCDFCGKAFARKSSYCRHIQIHTGEKPYKCDVCSRGFRDKPACIEHRRIHTGEKSFKCDLCAQEFTFKKTYTRHIRVHMGEKPHKCDFCPKAFIEKSHYDEHRRIHTGEKPYKCDLCDKAFSAKSLVGKHIRKIHTGEQKPGAQIDSQI